MDFGIVIAVVVVAAIVAPFFWLAWWAAASLGEPRTLVPVPAKAATGRPAARRIGYPVVVDSQLPGRSDAITVYGANATAPKTFCKGPDAAGRCPVALGDGTVPCAGCVLVLPVPIRGSRDWQIPVGFQNCLVGSYSAYRQAAR